MKLSAKAASILGIIATITAIGMYVAYLPQIQMNLAGQKGTPIQMLAINLLPRPRIILMVMWSES